MDSSWLSGKWKTDGGGWPENSAVAHPITAQHPEGTHSRMVLNYRTKSTGVPGVSVCPLKMSATSVLHCAKASWIVKKTNKKKPWIYLLLLRRQICSSQRADLCRALKRIQLHSSISVLTGALLYRHAIIRYKSYSSNLQNDFKTITAKGNIKQSSWPGTGLLVI